MPLIGFVQLLNGLFMLAGPLIVSVVLARVLKVPWWPLALIGGATFILSQVVRLPLLQGLTLALPDAPFETWTPDALFWFNTLILSFSAGLFEEGARWLVYRFWVKDARTWTQGVVFGAGHGAIEAAILGGLVLVGLVNMVVIRELGLETVGAALPPEQLAVVEAQLAAFWGAAWWEPLLGSVERVFAMTVHITLAVVVLQAFTRRNFAWVFLAMFLHGVFNVVGVATLRYAGGVAAEGALLVVALGCLGLLFALRPKAGGSGTGDGDDAAGEPVAEVA